MQRSVDKLRAEYLEKLDTLEQRMSGLEPVYRWPLPYDEVLHYECLYASGGGEVRATGGLPKPRQIKDPKLCRCASERLPVSVVSEDVHRDVQHYN